MASTVQCTAASSHLRVQRIADVVIHASMALPHNLLYIKGLEALLSDGLDLCISISARNGMRWDDKALALAFLNHQRNEATGDDAFLSKHLIPLGLPIYV